LVLSVHEQTLVDCIRAEFSCPGSTLSPAVACLSGTHVIGVVSAFPTEELRARQMTSAKVLIDCLPRDGAPEVLARMRQHAEALSPLPEPSNYLARLCVLPSERGSGTADLLLARAEADVSDARALCLHVHADNARAIAFYRRHGFFVLQERPSPYLVLAKAPSGSGGAAGRSRSSAKAL
jgi:GNAT superfamily N-acetyltransferase